jgi:hypothetical protein
MTVSSAYSRDSLRQTYSAAWHKRIAGLPLSALETLITDVITLHPEYQALINDSARTVEFEPGKDGTRENPFMHLGLHMAVREQIAIDRPAGVRDLHHSLCANLGGVHAADHVLMQALGETLWEAQRSGQAPDEIKYLARARAAQRLGI